MATAASDYAPRDSAIAYLGFLWFASSAIMRHLPEVDPQACKHPHHVLDTDLIAPDDHVLVLALTHALSQLGSMAKSSFR